MDVTAENGSNVTFTCEVFSYLPVNFTWLHNGKMLDDDDRAIVTNNDDPHVTTITLILRNVQLPESGSYVCRVTNRDGSTLSNDAMLSVIGK